MGNDVVSEDKVLESVNKEELSFEDVEYVLKFATVLNNAIGGVLTPAMLNERLKDISMNPIQATETDLTDAMNNVKGSEIFLQAFSQDFEVQSQPYRRLLSYLGNMLSFDITYTCTNAEKEDYKSDKYKNKYKNDLKIVEEFFNGFDYRKEFTIVVNQLLRNETFFACPRFENGRLTLQELPSSPEYTLITGKWAYGLMFDFNMNWFQIGGVNINDYPAFFKEKYTELFQREDGRIMPVYNPSLSPIRRGSSSWANWVSVPVNVGWCWKMNPAVATRVPYFSGLFLDLIQQPLMRSLQKNINMSAAARVLVGEIPMLKERGEKVRDLFAISPSNLGNFMSLVKSAIGDALKAAAVPLNNIKQVNYPLEEKLYPSYLKTALASSGVNSNLIFTNDLKMNTIETQLSLNTDEQLMSSLYPQFEDFLNFYVNKKTKKFKFQFKFEGTSFYNNRESRFNQQKDLMDKGIVMPQKVAAAIGMSPWEMKRQMEEAKAMGFVDELTPIVSAYQQSAGRPRTPDTKISDEGAQTQGDGANIAKGGKV